MTFKNFQNEAYESFLKNLEYCEKEQSKVEIYFFGNQKFLTYV